MEQASWLFPQVSKGSWLAVEVPATAGQGGTVLGQQECLNKGMKGEIQKNVA